MSMEQQEHEYAIGVRVVQELETEDESLNERKKNIMLVNNQISGWMQRVATKMAEMNNDLEGAQTIQGNSMIE